MNYPEQTTALVQRNTTQNQTLQTTFVDELSLARLAGEINTLNDNVQDLANKAISSAARLGEKLSQAKGMIDVAFDVWLENNCPRLKRSQAYNYMALAKKMPELLNDSVQSTGHRLLPSQAIALLSAPDDIKADVMERVEHGDTVTVAEINRMKKEKQQADEDYLSVLREKNQVEIENNVFANAIEDIKRENQQLKTDRGLESLVTKRVEAKQTEMQKNLDSLVAQTEKDYQAKIDSLIDRISDLKNDLGKAQHSDRLTQVQKEIAKAEEDLRRANARLETQNADAAFNRQAKFLIESAASVNTALLELNGKRAFYQPTIELLFRAAHDWAAIVECLRLAATLDHFDIEGEL